jgi:molybdopterin synthase sulfur carrier subunit
VSVKINIHPSFRHLTNGQTVVEVNGNTVGQCLDDLIRQFPQIKRWLFDKTGKLHNYVDIYVNGESAYPDELATPVKDGDELHIIVVISGG